MDDPDMLKVKLEPAQSTNVVPHPVVPTKLESTVSRHDQAVATGLSTAQVDIPIDQNEAKAADSNPDAAAADPELQSIRDMASHEDQDAGLSHSLDVIFKDSYIRRWLTCCSFHPRTWNS